MASNEGRKHSVYGATKMQTAKPAEATVIFLHQPFLCSAIRLALKLKSGAVLTLTCGFCGKVPLHNSRCSYEVAT